MKVIYSKKGKLLLKFIVVGFALVGLFSLVERLTGPLLNNKTASPEEPELISISYSYYADEDKDGLSNAKEFIFGSNPFDPDTDDDGVLDGEEINTGMDPLVAGKSLTERKSDNLSVRYFLWLQKDKNIIDGKIDQTLLSEFFNTQAPEALALSDENLSSVPEDASVLSLTEYLEKIGRITLPLAARGYIQIIEEFNSEETSALQATSQQIELALLDISRIVPPEQARDHYRKMVTILSTFKQMLDDVPKIATDPVRIEAHKRKMPQLLVLASEADRELQVLNKSVKNQ